MPSSLSWSLADVASIIGWKAEDLNALARDAQRLYSPYTKRKANGGRRLIAPPHQRLKLVQKALLDRVFPRLFPKRTGVIQVDAVLNARAHRHGRSIVTLDLKEAFPSTAAGMVLQVLRRAGLQPRAAQVVTRLCTFRGVLPQGAPTSNALLDAVLATFDREVIAFASHQDVLYTRYVDDMTVSGAEDVGPVVEYVSARLAAHSFSVHPGKTARGGGGVPIEVTGVRLVNGRTTATAKALEAAAEAVAAFVAVGSESNWAVAEGRLKWVERIDARAAHRMRLYRARG